MKVQRYGMVLEPLSRDHLEMVRLWRNQDYIRKRMQFQQVLSSGDQLQWFNSLDPERNLYWVIRCNDYPIGLVHIKDIDAALMFGEAGVFVGEPSYLETAQPMLAILVMMEVAFHLVGLSQLKAKIHHDNHKAIRFNQGLGYRLEPGQGDGFQYYTVNSEQFMTATHRLRANAARMFGTETGLEFSAGSNWMARYDQMNSETKELLGATVIFG